MLFWIVVHILFWVDLRLLDMVKHHSLLAFPQYRHRLISGVHRRRANYTCRRGYEPMMMMNKDRKGLREVAGKV
jgi:hypothetical protein